MALYPSEEWLGEYCRALNESSELQDFGFSENILLVITDLGLDELTIGDLSDDVLSDVPANVRDGLADTSLTEALSLIDERVRSSLPEPVEHLLNQTERDVVNDTIFVHIELEGGNCHGLSLVTDLSDLEIDSIFQAAARTWQSIVAGRPAMAAALCGDLEVIGNQWLRLKYLAELQLLCDIAADDVETEFLFEYTDRSFAEFVVDESLRGPITVQKWLTRETALAVRPFVPF